MNYPCVPIFYSAAARGAGRAGCSDRRVCLRNHTSELYHILCMLPVWPWFGPTLWRRCNCYVLPVFRVPGRSMHYTVALFGAGVMTIAVAKVITQLVLPIHIRSLTKTDFRCEPFPGPLCRLLSYTHLYHRHLFLLLGPKAKAGIRLLFYRRTTLNRSIKKLAICNARGYMSQRLS